MITIHGPREKWLLNEVDLLWVSKLGESFELFYWFGNRASIFELMTDSLSSHLRTTFTMSSSVRTKKMMMNTSWLRKSVVLLAPKTTFAIFAVYPGPVFWKTLAPPTTLEVTLMTLLVLFKCTSTRIEQGPKLGKIYESGTRMYVCVWQSRKYVWRSASSAWAV